MRGKLVKCLTTVATIAILTTSVNSIESYAASKPKLNKTKITLTVGKTTTLKVKGISKKTKITWKSTKKSVATVKKGKVTAKKKGTSIISAKFTYKKSGKKVTKTLKCKVTVKAKKVKAIATPKPTSTPTPKPTNKPTVAPTATPTVEPTATPTAEPTVEVVSPETPVHVHDYNAKYEVVKEANCYEEGLINLYCECGEVVSRTIDVSHGNHNFSIVSATETEEGYFDCHCNVCGQDYKDILPAVTEENYPLEGWVYKICSDEKHDKPYIWVKDYIGTSEYPALKGSYVIDGVEYQVIIRGELLCSSPTAKSIKLYNVYEELASYNSLHEKKIQVSDMCGTYQLNILPDSSVLPYNLLSKLSKPDCKAKCEWDGLNYRYIPLNDEAVALCEQYGYEWDKLWWEN